MPAASTPSRRVPVSRPSAAATDPRGAWASSTPASGRPQCSALSAPGTDGRAREIRARPGHASGPRPSRFPTVPSAQPCPGPCRFRAETHRHLSDSHPRHRRPHASPAPPATRLARGANLMSAPRKKRLITTVASRRRLHNPHRVRLNKATPDPSPSRRTAVDGAAIARRHRRDPAPSRAPPPARASRPASAQPLPGHRLAYGLEILRPSSAERPDAVVDFAAPRVPVRSPC